MSKDKKDTNDEEEEDFNFVYNNRLSDFIHNRSMRVSSDVDDRFDEIIENKIETLKEISKQLGKKKVGGLYIHPKPFDENNGVEFLKSSVAKRFTRNIGVTVSIEDLKRYNNIIEELLKSSIRRAKENGRKTVKEYDV